MKKLLVLMVGLCLVAGTAAAKNVHDHQLMMVEDSQGLFDDLSNKALFGVAQAGTTWWGWSSTGTGPWSIGAPGTWDFDDGGTLTCPVDDYTESSPVYIKNGAYAQYWTGEDVYAQIGVYWHADDFTYSGAVSPITGNYSGWCGVSQVDTTQICFTDAPGYGHNWNQWLCKHVTLDGAAPSIAYAYRNDSEPGFDYTYVIVDPTYPDSCGYVDTDCDTLRCYDGSGSGSESIDLTAWDDGDDCDELAYAADYSGAEVKVCFVGVSDGGWDDQDGGYDTIDGMFVVDDIILGLSGGPDTTDFESGTLEGWEACGGWSPGDYVAIRDRSDFINNDICGFDNCDMAGCVLAYYNPLIAGQYGNGGHYAGSFHKRAWSPPVDLTSEGPRGYLIYSDRYVDLPIANWIFYRYYVKFWQSVNCPLGAPSPAQSDNYVYYADPAQCNYRQWGFSQYVPTDADSVSIALSAWNGCEVWETTCTNGNETPIFDNVRMGTFSLLAPQASIRAVDNYTDSWPEDDLLTVGATALIDAANNKSQTGAFLRMADSAVIQLDAPNVQAEMCFRIEPGPGTDLGDAFFTTDYPDNGWTWTACELSDDVFCTRMDTAFAAGDGDTASAYEFQNIFEGYWATMVHELDPLYPTYGEGHEIFPDSLFTAGTKIYYAFRTSFVGGSDYSWLPFGADLAADPEGTCYEVMVLPDLCKDPPACLIYFDYYNRGSQAPIEEALTLLGREWDRHDLRAESSHQCNGVGNRLLGPGRYRLARGPIGPSFSHLTQYTAMLINNGNFDPGTTFSDGGTGTPDDPSNDITFLDNWINEGRYKGLWLSGNGVASDFAQATSGPKPGFLSRELATDLVSSSYVQWSGHDVRDGCRVLKTRTGEMKIINTYSVQDSLRVFGSGCPNIYNYDVIEERDGETGIEFVSLMYDLSGGYASVDHIFRASNAPFDTVRTKIDGFSLHNLRPISPPCATDPDRVGIAMWIRDVLGGNRNDGYFYDRAGNFQYCPPQGTESSLLDVPRGGRTYSNALFQNYPNPFRGGAGTTIHYSVAKGGQVEIRIFDVAGRLVNTIVDQAALGDNFVTWDGKARSGRDVPSGVYFYQIKTGQFSAHKKMLLVN